MSTRLSSSAGWVSFDSYSVNVRYVLESAGVSQAKLMDQDASSKRCQPVDLIGWVRTRSGHQQGVFSVRKDSCQPHIEGRVEHAERVKEKAVT